jgi:hypothetical protein
MAGSQILLNFSFGAVRACGDGIAQCNRASCGIVLSRLNSASGFFRFALLGLIYRAEHLAGSAGLAARMAPGTVRRPARRAICNTTLIESVTPTSGGETT